ncbi:MAG TPA: hypothetical protein ENH55_11590 [Aurantimonas coralicida]|uniref:Methyltransferase FkbM domain-containing protein n=1 Tax=Aurantimonas coralicida TaxID=182270 RepID=A0A9C9NGE5_9HYPH|nr:hypothetical protein [Aurantimonas coralicida]HEU01388.1 hypothetical protein [Aurantimonas coralicida]
MTSVCPAASPGRDDRVSRHFDTMPHSSGASALLRAVNAAAPGGSPVVPGNRPLWLYGAGDLGKLARSHLDAVGQPIAGVVDRNAEAHANDPAWAGIPVHAPETVSKEVKAKTLLAISIVTSPYAPLHKVLNDQGWTTIVPVYDVAEAFRDRHPLSNGWFASQLSELELEEADLVLAAFADDASRAHYLRFAAWRLGRQEWDFAGAPVAPRERFFIPEIKAALRPDERFLDAGAHHGGVTARLLAETEGVFSTVWAVEPDEASRAALRSYVEGLPPQLRDRIHVVDAVLGARREPVRFHDGLGYASQIAVTGQVLRSSEPLDGLDLDVTFIKLHLEGAELAALIGARETLHRCRPLVALTVYHDAAGLIETPRWLMRNMPDYAIFMRTHAWCGTGAVLYALPKERLVP